MADSPLSVLLFSAFLLSLLAGRRIPLLEAFAYFSNLKYGPWTVVVMALAWARNGVLDFQMFHLSLSHGAMALQAILFSARWAPSPGPVLVATAWALVNDYADYTWGLHPTLPEPSMLPLVAQLSRGSTPLVALVLLYLAWRRRR